MHHGQYFIIVLDPEKDIFDLCANSSEWADLHPFHSLLELAFLELWSALFENVESSGEQNIRKTKAKKVSQVTLIIFCSFLW